MHDQRRTLPSEVREEKGEGERRVESRRGRGVRRTTRFYLYDYIPMLSSSFLPFPFLLSPLSRASFFIPYLLFFLFLCYTNVARNIRIYIYIFLYFDIYSPFRISFAFIRLIFYAFLCSRDKQNCFPLTIFQLSYLINIFFFHLVFPTLSWSASSFRYYYYPHHLIKRSLTCF